MAACGKDKGLRGGDGVYRPVTSKVQGLRRRLGKMRLEPCDASRLEELLVRRSAAVLRGLLLSVVVPHQRT